MPDTRKQHVIIIGAGITGLLIAHGLQKAGVPYSIFEAEDNARFRPREWTMAIHWSLPLMEELLPRHLASRIVKDGSVDASLDYAQHPNNGGYIYDAVSGTMLKDLAVSGRFVRVSRRRLRALCREGVDVHFNHKVETVTCNDQDDAVTVRFTNGEQCTGTLLVGCDGPRSTVRSSLFASDPEAGEAQNMEGVVCMPSCVSYADPEVAKLVRSGHPVFYIGISPKVFPFVSVQEVPDLQRPETWKFFVFPAWLGEKKEHFTNEERIREMKEKASTLAEPFRASILNIPDDTHVPYVDLAYWIAKPWDTRHGLVTLAGDAAHPMPPFRGQGMNHATQDAYNLVAAVRKLVDPAFSPKDGIQQATLIQEYSDETAERGAEETKLTLKNGSMMMNYEDFKNSPYMKKGFDRG